MPGARLELSRATRGRTAGLLLVMAELGPARAIHAERLASCAQQVWVKRIALPQAWLGRDCWPCFFMDGSCLQ